MSEQIFSQYAAYRFIKVEDYFAKHTQWQTIGPALSSKFDDSTLTLEVIFKINGQKAALKMEFIDDDIFRLRFNPTKTTYQNNTKNVIQDSTELMRNARDKHNKLFQKQGVGSARVIRNQIRFSKNGQEYHYIQCWKYGQLTMIVNVYKNPFQIEVKAITPLNPNPETAPVLWRTAVPGLYFTKNGQDGEYSIIQVVQKPANTKFVGFGEQGGICLSRNGTQLNYFNFDNMRYMQVYNRGPMDIREPLYHSEPLFFQYNNVPGQKIANALFVANPGQVLMDIGYSSSRRYMFGTRFNDLDYYFFIGQDTQKLIYNFTSIVGRSTLKPRYCLGYHQGCYGYQRRVDVEWSVNKHRQYGIPLDGMHIDVDLQNKYQTFTINLQTFPNPQEMFTNLRNQGIKCSTNITPVVSREDPNYQTYVSGRDSNYFVLDKRHHPDDPESLNYQLYGGGSQYRPNDPNRIEGYNSGKPFVGGVYYGNQGSVELGSSGHYPDFGRDEVQEWWGKQYEYLMNAGLEFIWQDMTTPAIRDKYGDMKSFPFRLLVTSSAFRAPKEEETVQTLVPFIKEWNMYSYNLHKATYKGLNKLKSRDNKRNFIIGRGSFTGSHRYAGLWTGDNCSSWDFLRMNVSQVLSLGLCGVIINGQDIGGFQQDKDEERWANPQLLIRWTVAGAFLPWFRNHYVRKGRKEFQQIFQYEQYFYERNLPIPEPQDLYKMVMPICKHYIQLRYRLLQLFYDLMFDNTLTGLPICRPLFFGAPDDESIFNDKEQFLNNQFFVGRDMLIAPILWPRLSKGVDDKGCRDVYLPAGFNWYHFKNNTQPLSSKIQGGTTIRDFDASLNASWDHINFVVPIYVKEGAIIPTIEIEQYVGELNKKGQQNPITYNIYPGDSHQEGYNAYLDDGVSRSSASTKAHPIEEGGDPQAKEEYRQVNVSHIQTPTERVVVLTREHDHYTPFEKFLFVAFIHSPEESVPTSVTVNGTEVTYFKQDDVSRKAESLWNSPVDACYFNDSIKVTFVKVFDNKNVFKVVANQ